MQAIITEACLSVSPETSDRFEQEDGKYRDARSGAVRKSGAEGASREEDQVSGGQTPLTETSKVTLEDQDLKSRKLPEVKATLQRV